MYLLKEVSTNTSGNILTESTGEKKYFIEGVFIQAEKKNKNKRIYPIKIIENEVARFVKERVVPNRAIGELEHPDYVEPNLKNSSHLIEVLKMDGNDVYGKARLMATPNGQIAKVLMDEGVSFGVSTRGVGSVRESGDTIYVQDDFYMTAIDIVSDPSAPDAFVQGLVEARQWVWGTKVPEQKLESFKKQVKTAPKRKLEETFIRVFSEFMKEISR